jgi:hypothetical protein
VPRRSELTRRDHAATVMGDRLDSVKHVAHNQAQPKTTNPSLAAVGAAVENVPNIVIQKFFRRLSPSLTLGLADRRSEKAANAIGERSG